MFEPSVKFVKFFNRHVISPVLALTATLLPQIIYKIYKKLVRIISLLSSSPDELQYGNNLSRRRRISANYPYICIYMSDSSILLMYNG